MTDIHPAPDIRRAPIPYPQAWTAAALGGKAPLTKELGPDALRALDALAAALRGRDFPDISRSDASDPAIVEPMTRVREEVMHGRGIAVVRGPEPSRYDPEDYARLYWALGAHLGQGVVQSYFSDYVARVERNPNLPWRGTTTDMELRPHTDFHEVMSLASVSLPESGGVSGFVSSLAVHNEILRTRPQLLPALYEGWYNTSALRKQLSSRKTPIFCCVGGAVSCFYNRVFFAKPEEAPEPFPAALCEAMAYMDSLCVRDDLIARFTLEPGEMVFWHNFLVMHSRTSFHDTGTRHRLLLRLWLNVPDGRPMAAEVRARAGIIDQDHIAGRRAP
ncbi:MAG: TauD/TfdA family dioxygenase [Steroidobacteraceae bacterium]